MLHLAKLAEATLVIAQARPAVAQRRFLLTLRDSR
jgi:hypothetical protein